MMKYKLIEIPSLIVRRAKLTVATFRTKRKREKLLLYVTMGLYVP